MRNATRGRCLCLVAALATAAACVPLQAQIVSSLVTGDRVRVFTPSLSREGVVGMIVGRAPDTLTILSAEHSDTVIVPLSELTRLELSKGRHRNGLKGMVIGLLLGAAGGAIAGRASGDDRGWGDTASQKELSDAVACGVAGLIIGGTIGSNSETEDWVVIRPLSGSRLSVAPRSDHRLAVAYSVAFSQRHRSY